MTDLVEVTEKDLEDENAGEDTFFFIYEAYSK